MADLWKGRFSGELAKPARDFNQSLHVDGRMIVEDIKGSLAHVAMLGRQELSRNSRLSESKPVCCPFSMTIRPAVWNLIKRQRTFIPWSKAN